MTSPLLDQATALVWEQGRRGVFLPVELRGKLELPDAYRVNLGILQRHLALGERQAGWKVGLTAKAMREQQKVHEPCFGFLLASSHKASGHHFALGNLIAPGFENELCIRIGTTLRGPGVDFEQARRAIAAVAPALEIVEKRGDFAADLALTMADNAQQKAFVTGPEMPLGLFDPADSFVDVYRDDQHLEHASGAEVMGSSIYSIAWLANKLAEFDLALEAGMRVMSGSYTKQISIDSACRIVSRFVPFGDVAAEFHA